MSGRESRLLGRWGEERAAEYLRGKGFTLRAANWRCRFGEIDLVADDGVYLCFVEVKLRRSAAFGTPGAYVDRRKREKLRTSAMLYLARHPTQLQPRFDVIEVYTPQEAGKPEICHLENAF